jgi:hypothetical protein
VTPRLVYEGPAHTNVLGISIFDLVCAGTSVASESTRVLTYHRSREGDGRMCSYNAVHLQPKIGPSAVSLCVRGCIMALCIILHATAVLLRGIIDRGTFPSQVFTWCVVVAATGTLCDSTTGRVHTCIELYLHKTRHANNEIKYRHVQQL